MAAVDFVTGYITNYVEGMVRPYVEQGAAAVGDVAGGVLFTAGDKISAAGRGVGSTINGYASGVGNSISGVAKSIPGAPQIPAAVPSMSGSMSQPQRAIEGTKGTSSKPSASLSSTASKSSDPRHIDRPAMPTTAAGRKQEMERLKAKGITRAKDNAAAKKSLPAGGPAGGAAPKQLPSAPAQKALPSSGGAATPDVAKADADLPEEVRRSRRTAKKAKRSART